MATSIARRGVESEILAGVEIFSCLPDSDVDELAETARIRSFKKGESIYHQDDPSGGIFVVLSGLVKLQLTAPTDKTLTIACKEEGSWFGVLSFFDQANRPINAVAIEKSSLLVLGRDPLRKFLEQRPIVCEKLAEAMVMAWRRHIERTYELAFLDATGRLVAALLQLSRPQPPSEYLVLRRSITQGELACFARTSRETVNKWLRFFVHKGWIEHSRDGLRILDPAALRGFIGYR